MTTVVWLKLSQITKYLSKTIIGRQQLSSQRCRSPPTWLRHFLKTAEPHMTNNASFSHIYWVVIRRLCLVLMLNQWYSNRVETMIMMCFNKEGKTVL